MSLNPKSYKPDAYQIDGSFEEGTIAQGVLGTVEWYSAEKGFGFVDVSDTDYQAFLHAKVLKEKGVTSILEGDQILCDIARNDTGPYVNIIHDFASDKGEIETVDVEVIRLFPERKYGFAKIANDTRDVYFHYTALNFKTLEGLDVGSKLRVEISSDTRGTGYRVRNVV